MSQTVILKFFFQPVILKTFFVYILFF